MLSSAAKATFSGLMVIALLSAGCGGGDAARSAAGEDEMATDEVVVVDEVDADAETDADDADGDGGDADGDGDTTNADGDGGGTNADADTTPSDTENKTSESDEPNNLLDLVTSGGNRGVRACVRNETGSPTPRIYVQFTKADSGSSGYLYAAGDEQQRCGEGTTLFGADLIGKIYFAAPGAGTYEFDARNDWISIPEAVLRRTSPKQDINCIDHSFSEGEKATFDDGKYQITFERLTDSKWKEFRILIRETSQPGNLKECTYRGFVVVV